MARMSVVRIDESFFRQLAQYRRDNEGDVIRVHWAIDRIVMGYAMVSLSEAQKRSMGPVVAPGSTGGRVRFGVRGKNLRSQAIFSPGAWKIPVRRITGAYFAGWHIEQLYPGVWMFVNDSREAYFIEFGINHSGTGKLGPGGMRVRIRRPIMKISVLKALEIIAGTGADVKMFENIFRHGTYHSSEVLPYRVMGNARGGPLAEQAVTPA